MRPHWLTAFVLPPDVEMIPVAELSPALRAELEGSESEFLVQRPGIRDGSKVVDADAVRLLELFRRPEHIVNAVVAFSRTTGQPPESLLEECFPLLRRLVAAGILVEAAGPESQPLSPLLAPGSRVGRWEIEECVRLIDDCEIYRARDGNSLAALKRLRPRGVGRGGASLLAREAAVLARLDGTVTPALLDSGLSEPLPWLAMRWHPGVRADRLAPDRDLPAIGLAIAEAYAHLHRQAVLHGDVHPGNVLVGERGDVMLVDFALGHVLDEGGPPTPPRGAARGYWEPEFASAVLRGEPEPSPTPSGEQYAVGTLLDRVLTGQEALDLPVEPTRDWQTVLEGERRSFADRGRPAWPSLERVLRRATSLRPEHRYPDVAAFATAWRAALASGSAAIRPSDDAVRAFLREATPGGQLFARGLAVPPRSSFNFGAAGIAFALQRLARAREDPELLGVAEIWQERAEHDLLTPEGLHDVGEFRSDELGPISPFHAASGVWLSRALLARAAGDVASTDRAITLFLDAVGDAHAPELDLTLGTASAVLGAAVLYGLRPLPDLRRRVDAWNDALWRTLDAEPAIRDGTRIGYLGIAHGWAGFLYATLAWARATARRPPDSVLERLDQLAVFEGGTSGARPIPVAVPGHALSRGASQVMDGWCHGQAGHIFLQLLAFEVTGSRESLERAVRLGHLACQGTEHFGNLCCGLAGRAYAMLALHRATRDACWLDAARRLARRAVRAPGCDRWPNSLYKGRVGLAVIVAECDRPETARMPLFEDEGWLNADPAPTDRHDPADSPSSIPNRAPGPPGRVRADGIGPGTRAIHPP